MRFWDSSAIVPLLGDEAPRDALLRLLDADAELLVWWGTPVECVSALARRERAGGYTPDDVTGALARLARLAEGWLEVLPVDPVRTVARRLLRTHPLRAADSLQLAAAIVAAGHDPASLDFVSLDERLADAAGREGFRVVSG